MNFNQAKEKAKEIIKIFVDEINLDGELYADLCTAPIIAGQVPGGDPGKFINPGNEYYEEIIGELNLNEEIREIADRAGIIIIEESVDYGSDAIETIIHETFHANRNVLTYDAYRENDYFEKENQRAYLSEGGTFKQTTNKYGSYYGDASQDILKGNIDTSKKTIDKYKDITDDEMLEISDSQDEETPKKMREQINIDEALVGTMSHIACELYRSKNHKENKSIWQVIEEVRDIYEDDDCEGSIASACKIILKHKNFELFYWMLDPITYSAGDLHYDFFGQYTIDDTDLVAELHERSENVGTYESFLMSIDKEQIKATAESGISYIQEALLMVQKEKDKQKQGEEIC